MQTGFEPDQANEQQVGKLAHTHKTIPPIFSMCLSSRQGNSFFNLNNPREKDNFAWNWKYQAGPDVTSTRDVSHRFCSRGEQQ